MLHYEINRENLIQRHFITVEQPRRQQKRAEKVYINALMHSQLINFQSKKYRIDLLKAVGNPDRQYINELEACLLIKNDREFLKTIPEIYFVRAAGDEETLEDQRSLVSIDRINALRSQGTFTSSATLSEGTQQPQ